MDPHRPGWWPSPCSSQCRSPTLCRRRSWGRIPRTHPAAPPGNRNDRRPGSWPSLLWGVDHPPLSGVGHRSPAAPAGPTGRRSLRRQPPGPAGHQSHGSTADAHHSHPHAQGPDRPPAVQVHRCGHRRQGRRSLGAACARAMARTIGAGGWAASARPPTTAPGHHLRLERGNHPLALLRRAALGTGQVHWCLLHPCWFAEPPRSPRRPPPIDCSSSPCPRAWQRPAARSWHRSRHRLIE